MARFAPPTSQVGPHPAAIFGSVALTVVAGFGFFFLELSIATDRYRTAHQLQPVWSGFWIFGGYQPATVTLEQLGVGLAVSLVLGAVFYAVIIHPVVGRLVVAVMQNLAGRVDSLYRLGGLMTKWDPETSVLLGAAWPISALTIPVMAVAIVIGMVYRSLWQW